jgi:hypothetical protein
MDIDWHSVDAKLDAAQQLMDTIEPSLLLSTGPIPNVDSALEQAWDCLHTQLKRDAVPRFMLDCEA